MTQRIPKSKLDCWDTREEVSLRKLAQTAFESVALEDLTDVDIASPQNGEVLRYDESLGMWINDTPGGGSVALDDLSDVVISTPTDGQVLTYDEDTGTWVNDDPSGGGSGTVTSVSLTAPSQFTVTGSPVTTAGTLDFEWNVQVANRVLAGPTTGADAAPTFRALVADDIPGLPVDQIRNFTEERLLGWGEVVSGSGNGALISLGTGFTWSGDTLNLNLKTINSESLLGPGDITIAAGPAPVITESGTNRNISNADAGAYIRFTNTGAKTATFGTGITTTDAEFNLRNAAASGDLTITPSSTTINGPTIIAPGETATVKLVATATFDVIAGDSITADNVSYDNATSDLAATDVQAAIDEIVGMIPSGVVDNAPTIAQTLWWESFNFLANDAGYSTAQSGFSAISVDGAERSMRFITGAGTTANVWQRRANNPTFDMRIGAAAYTSRSRAAWVFNKPVPGVLAHIACGAMPSTSSGTPPTTLFGVIKNTTDDWEICARVTGTDLVTPVALTITEGQRLLVCVQMTGDGTSNVTEAKIGVFDFATGALIDQLTWTGTNSVANINFEIWTARPDGSTGSPGAQETLRMYYQAYGPVPSPTLNPFFAQL